MECTDTENLEMGRDEAAHILADLKKQVEGASMLSKEISLLKAGIAHDLQLIRLGEQGEEYEHLKYICLDKLSPKYNLVKVLMTNIALVEAEPAKVGRPKKEAEEGDEKITIPIAGELDPEPVVVEKGNVFEMMSRKIAAKNAPR